MSSREQLRSYLRQVEKRLRFSVLLRGALIVAAVALVATLLLVLAANAFAFSQGSITGARLALFSALAAALAFGLALPFYALNRRRVAGRAEAVFPEFQQRLITFVDREAKGRDPFLELLAADTLQLARASAPAQLAPNRKLFLSAAAGGACLGALLWMIMSGPGYLGYGAKRLWTGPSRNAATFYDIRVTPGNAAVRRNSGQVITARLVGFDNPEARLYARYQSASKWETASMQPQSGTPAFQFVFAGIPEDVDYYVQAGRVQSRRYTIRVIDVPSIKHIQVTYRYPAWTRLPDAVQEQGGDLSAVEGTAAELAISTDRPVPGGVLVLNTGKEIALSGGERNVYKGAIDIQKDGSYHVAATSRGQLVRLSDDFVIEARKANPPEISITRPRSDYQASPIEEVTVSVNAADDYGLNGVSLRYSVNGGAEKTVNVLKRAGVKKVEDSTILYLENFKVVPGDVVSFYARASDGKSTSPTGMSFIEVQPFEREYSQSQLAGGGGLGGQQNELSEREKEIIAATWNQEGNKQATSREAAGAGKFLSGVQDKLRDQALWLTGRMQGRGLGERNEEFGDFQKDMSAAAEAMGPASAKLREQDWSKAIPSEEKALQQLLRAEATFRRIQVAFGNGGGGGARGGRELASLAGLELNTEKNQYETGQTADSAKQRAQETDKAFQKLSELARREQELAQQQQSNNSQNFQQRWQQEMLRREAEQLQKQLERLAIKNSQGAQGNRTSGAEQSNGESASAAGEPIQRVINQLREATKEMVRAGSEGASAADARRAASQLEEARKLLAALQGQQVSPQLNSLAREADRLAGKEQDQAARIRQMFTGNGQPNSFGQPGFEAGDMSRSKLADDRQLLANDLSRLQNAMESAARSMESTQPAAAARLHEMLGNADHAELSRRLQRSAESIRFGFDPGAKTMEPTIAAGIASLQEGIRQARQALKGQQQNPVEEALNQLQRLRSEIEGLSSNRWNAAATNAQASREQSQGGQQAQGDQRGERGTGNGQAVGDQATSGGNASNGFQSGGPGGPRAWQAGRAPGMGTFIEAPGNGSSRDESSTGFAGAQRELEALRRELRYQPQSLPDLQALMRDLQRLGPGNFPRNPALVEQLRTQALTSVDKLELQLRRDLAEQSSHQARSGDSLRIPPGYQEAVASYFRRLSKSH
ncbi:MAG: hypothetical protein ACRD1N_09140 [Terriglobia bacterium]